MLDEHNVSTFDGERPVFLDDLSLLWARVGYGTLGRHGSLGYEGQRVRIFGQEPTHALSTHPPAQLCFQLDRRFRWFQAQVAINGDVAAGTSAARFSVFADGRWITTVQAAAGEPPRDICAELGGCRLLELVVETDNWECCHAVWLAPRLSGGVADAPARILLDSLRRARIHVPPTPLSARRVVATVVSPGFENMADDLLGSLAAYGNCHDAKRLLFAVGASDKIDRLARKYGAEVVHCESIGPVSASIKAIMYSMAHVVEAEAYLALDADMIVLGDLSPIFAALDALPEESILACREGNKVHHRDLGQGMPQMYGGRMEDFASILGESNGESGYPLVVNDGLFAGRRAALLALDRCLRAMPGAVDWLDVPGFPWRNQMLFNLAIAKLKCGVELDATYNLQLCWQDVTIEQENGRLRARWQDQEVRGLHANGSGRHKFGPWRGTFASVQDPLVGPLGGDGYAEFLRSLRAWVGRHGLAKLAWSFYGTTDARSARIADASTFPLLALLHYLVRSNGCVRMLETGTARGVSTACLASAVSHRPGGRIVTLDLWESPERGDLWSALPEPMRDCIEPRTVECLQGMRQAIQNGEQYDAALLDTVHTCEHVRQEFELAAQLVRPGGLILIHDVCYAHGTVGQAIDEIQAQGYGVTRLWTAGSAVREDDNLGLVVIENRRIAAA